MATPQLSSEPSFDGRIEDYFDDKLQSAADLDSLDELLANVEIQRTQLQTQLDDALQELEQARRMTDSGQDSLLAQIEDFQKLQESIDLRVKIAAASDAPSQAIARLQEPMKKAQVVELAHKYLALLQDVEELRTEARSHLPQDPKAALGPYAKLKQTATRMRSISAGDGLHLVEYVNDSTEKLWTEMKGTMSAELEAILQERGWPKVDPESEMDDEWVACIEKLIDLQIPEITYSAGVIPLLPFDVMSSIFVSEFRFHFLSDKRTSEPQAIGTHCFPWFLNTIEKWEDFFRDNLGPLLVAKFHDTPMATNTAYVDPVSALITAMLPVMKEKVNRVAAVALKQPSFLSSFVAQLMSFDENVRSRFNYDGGDSDAGWPGLATEILDEHFETWFQAEKNFALERFNTIMSSNDARNIDYDYAGDGRMKPTYASVRVTDLLKSVTSQYSRVRKFKHKIRFLIGLQLDILDEYHDRLRGSLEAYQSLTSTIGRTLHGVSKEQRAALEGTGALETLCKVIGSADHIVNTLNDWGNEDFFIELWDELQDRAAKRSSGASIGGTLSYSDVKERTSTAADEDEGGLFDETIAAYSMRRKGALDLLGGALAGSHSTALRSYVSKVQWTTVGDDAVLDDPNQLDVSPELDEPLHVLKRNLDFTLRALSTAAFRRVWREALQKLETILWNEVLMNHSFTAFGAAQFMRDGSAIFATLDRYIAGGSATLESLSDGMGLLNLPTEEGENGGMTLQVATDRAFTNNDEARKVLEELQLGALTPQNARNILQRRVENSEDLKW